MKKIAPFLLLAVISSSCKNTWTQSDKESFYEACMEDANKWSGGQDKSKTYCDCVIIKVMEKYPHVGDALDHIETLAVDPEIKGCRTPIYK